MERDRDGKGRVDIESPSVVIRGGVYLAFGQVEITADGPGVGLEGLADLEVLHENTRGLGAAQGSVVGEKCTGDLDAGAGSEPHLLQMLSGFFFLLVFGESRGQD